MKADQEVGAISGMFVPARHAKTPDWLAGGFAFSISLVAAQLL
jgi:hypothetical protein